MTQPTRQPPPSTSDRLPGAAPRRRGSHHERRPAEASSAGRFIVAIPRRRNPASKPDAGATGGRGPNRDYLVQTVAHLEALGICDVDLGRLAARVRQIQES